MVDHGSNASGSDEEESEGLDLQKIAETTGFVLRAAARRRILAVSTFLVIATLGVTIGATMPRTYTAQVKLFAQPSNAIHILGGGLPQLDNAAVDNPIKNVSSMIMRRDNLVGLVRDSNLVERMRETRPRALRLKDRALGAIFGKPSPEDAQQAVVYTLEKNLEVVTDEPTSTVTITVDWSDPQLTFDLANLVQRNFLEARYDSEVAMVTDSISVLEDHAKTEMGLVDAELDAYQKTVANWVAKQGPSPGRTVRVYAPAVRAFVNAHLATGPDPGLVRALEEKRVEIRAEEEAHQHSVEGLRQQLVEAQLTLTPMHPTVVALQQQLEAMSQPPPELVQLRGEERTLMGQIATPAASAAAAPSPVASPKPAPHDETEADADAGSDFLAGGLDVPAALDRDGQLQLAQSKLQSAIHGYDEALRRLDAAKVELEITRTAYKHQYTVVTPAEFPKHPKKPTAQIVAIASVVLGALFAVLIAALVDILGGRVMEPWQVRRKLGLDIIGELDRPS
jgi:uncharacterized protein involved in exopolysaccharide biosynthesis